MSYIGRGLDKISNIEKLDTITFDGSSSYTLQKNSVNFTPNSANSLQVSIDGVVQAGNFTVSGSTIDFGVAIPGTSTCDFIFHYGTGVAFTPADGTVGIAQLSATGTKDATTFLRGDNTFSTISAGITEADQWRITANWSTVAPITSGWERNDTSGYGTLGTGMTESSGIFTFPSTGIWFIQFNSYADCSVATLYTRTDIEVTVNNSTYNVVAQSYGSSHTTSAFNSQCSTFIFDVTNTTTHKARFALGQNSSGTPSLKGSTTTQASGVTFIRLGDT